MLNVGPLELLTIAVLALVVLGPDRLLPTMRSVGRAVGELRRISGGFQDELRRAMDEAIDDSDLDEMPASPPDKPVEVPPVIPPEEAAGLDLPSERADGDGQSDDDYDDEEASPPAASYIEPALDESASVTKHPEPEAGPVPAPEAEIDAEPETPK